MPIFIGSQIFFVVKTKDFWDLNTVDTSVTAIILKDSGLNHAPG